METSTGVCRCPDRQASAEANRFVGFVAPRTNEQQRLEAARGLVNCEELHGAASTSSPLHSSQTLSQSASFATSDVSSCDVSRDVIEVAQDIYAVHVIERETGHRSHVTLLCRRAPFNRRRRTTATSPAGAVEITRPQLQPQLVRVTNFFHRRECGLRKRTADSRASSCRNLEADARESAPAPGCVSSGVIGRCHVGHRLSSSIALR